MKKTLQDKDVSERKESLKAALKEMVAAGTLDVSEKDVDAIINNAQILPESKRPVPPPAPIVREGMEPGWWKAPFVAVGITAFVFIISAILAWGNFYQSTQGELRELRNTIERLKVECAKNT